MEDPTEEQYESCLWEHGTHSRVYCKFIHDAGEIESCWFDCMHPQREYLTCPYRNINDCHLSAPDVEMQKRHVEDCMRAYRFWRDRESGAGSRKHICDFTLEDLKERHKHVLCLVEKYDPVIIGTLIAGRYYNDVWNSRSCSSHLANLVGTGDYLDFYCGSSTYYFVKTFGLNPVIDKFDFAADKDDSKK